MEYQRIYAKIDLDAIEHNIDLVREKITTDVKLLLVVKADAYGHGAVMLAREFEEKADYFAVAEMNEAIELRKGGVKKPILILGYTSPALFEKALEYDITLTMFHYERIKKLSGLAVSMGKTAKIHFALDTGMSRIGWSVCEKSADEAAMAAKLPGIFVEGIFSHFATADGIDKRPSMEQRKKYDEFIKMLADRGVNIPIKHINNSAGILEFDKYYDMAREGIILYGLYPSPEVKDEIGERFPLCPAMELITHISHIKELEANRGISYGFTYVTERTMKVATIPVGYADGYPRALSNKGAVLIHGKRCPILGRVCMDQMMVDVSDIPDAKIEDKVVLVGRDKDKFISVEELADAAYSFNYEFVCGVARRVPRVYFRDGKPIKTVLHLED
ncbi:MAG: alanine racemase [Eubacteriales bacterium]